jgi:hypothetical protein
MWCLRAAILSLDLFTSFYQLSHCCIFSLQELLFKGKIRTYARIRPYLGNESGGSDFVYTEGANKICVAGTRGQCTFTFDRVFPPSADQAAVFEEVSSLIQHFLTGNNVCVFSFGQTGSGKTHTMMGNLCAPEQEGLILWCF